MTRFRPFKQAISRGLLLVAVILGAALANMATAQTLSDSNLLQVLKNQGTVVDDQGSKALKPDVLTYLPAGARKSAPGSRLETIYSARAGRQLQQFGYDVLGVPMQVSLAQVGSIQDEYVLGVGDEIVVTFRGQENSTFRTEVDRDGHVIVPKMAPVMAAGRTMADFRADFLAHVSQSFVSTDAYISLGDVRQVSVLVAGEVRSPGVRIVSGLAGPLDALMLSGGVSKTGTLRAVKLIRNGHVRVIDLYSVILDGAASNLGTLRDGDKILVPTIGPTVAVTGSVKRQAIYELPPGASAVDANALVRLAGGVEIAGTYNLNKLQLESDGISRLIPLPRGGTIRSGEVLFVESSREVSLDEVRLTGAVRLGGVRPRSSNPTVGALIRGPNDLSEDAYTPFALIIRRDRLSNAKLLVPFSLSQVLNGGGDVPLQSDDMVFVFSMTEIRTLTRGNTTDTAPFSSDDTSQQSPVAQKKIDPRLTTQGGGGEGDDNATQSSSPVLGSWSTTANPQAALASSILQAQFGGHPAKTDDTPTASDTRPPAPGQRISQVTDAIAESARVSTNESGPVSENIPFEEVLAGELNVAPEALRRVLYDHTVRILGEVGDPQIYLAAPGTSLDMMLRIAGGVSRDADLSAVEVTSTKIDTATGTSQTIRASYSQNDGGFQKVDIQPSDVIRVRPVFSDRQNGRIVVTGEVRYPGTFDIIRNERLSSVLARAGGLTEQAYPYGAVFTRRRAAIDEKAGNERTAQALEAQLGTLVVSAANAPATAQGSTTPSGLPLLAGLAQQLRDAPALGRITVVSDPTVLVARPDLDILLEPGDTLYIPQRPSTVTVSGEVLNAGAFRYEPGLSVADYVRRAGGTTQSADSSRVFVVLPDGTARPEEQNWLSIGENAIPPGSTVIIPRDLRPFDFTQMALTVTQIFSQLAVTAASLSVISK
jgi:protein involved in polysaccharide export with SLBB domain